MKWGSICRGGPVVCDGGRSVRSSARWRPAGRLCWPRPPRQGKPDQMSPTRASAPSEPTDTRRRRCPGTPDLLSSSTFSDAARFASSSAGSRPPSPAVRGTAAYPCTAAIGLVLVIFRTISSEVGSHNTNQRVRSPRCLQSRGPTWWRITPSRLSASTV